MNLQEAAEPIARERAMDELRAAILERDALIERNRARLNRLRAVLTMRHVFALLCILWLSVAPTWAAIAFVSDGGYNYGAGGTLSVTLTTPAGIASGNFEVAFLGVQDQNGLSTVNTLSGWTLIYGPIRGALAVGVYETFYAFYKIAGGSEPGTYTFTGTPGSGSTNLTMDGDVRAYSGNATSGSIINYAIGAGGTAGSVVVPTFSGHETFVSGEWWIGAASDLNNVVASSATPTLSNVYSNAGNYDSYYVGNYTPGSVPGTTTFTAGGYSTATVAIGFTLLPPSGGPTCPRTRSLMGAGC